MLALFGCTHVSGTFIALPPGHPNRVDTADYYVEIGFAPGAGLLLAGGDSGEFYLRWNRADWSAYNELLTGSKVQCLSGREQHSVAAERSCGG